MVILGGGLAGLSTGYVLSRAGARTILIEGAPNVGGLSITVEQGGFRFDIGGHRFLTKNKKIENFVLDLLGDDCLVVPRKSKIYMLNRYFDYPLSPANALFGLGILTTLQIIADYLKERVKSRLTPPEIISLEDWVVNQFGRKMFDLYFKKYSEKVWGLGCDEISKEWVAQRIDGLSLGKAIKNAFVKLNGKEIPTLADQFYYPQMGIGQISDRLRAGIEENNKVSTSTRVIRMNHDGTMIRDIIARNCSHTKCIAGREFVSSIPLTHLVNMLSPAAPPEILAAAARLKFRDIVIVTIMLNRESITDLSWMYLPGDDIPFGRIHEPKNWSPRMAPAGKSHVVAEYFCFKDDEIWNSSDEKLTALTVEHLAKLGFIGNGDVLDSCVLRRTKAYPIFEIGYREHYEKILAYLKNFKNLHIAGRGGMFRYYNMDHAMESGISVAENILNN